MKVSGGAANIRTFSLSWEQKMKLTSTRNRTFRTLNDMSCSSNKHYNPIQTLTYRFFQTNNRRITRWSSSIPSTFSKHRTPVSFSSSSISYDDEPTFTPIRQFPSLIIGKHGYISPQGTFAEIQAQVRSCFFFAFILHLLQTHPCESIILITCDSF